MGYFRPWVKKEDNCDSDDSFSSKKLAPVDHMNEDEPAKKEERSNAKPARKEDSSYSDDSYSHLHPEAALHLPGQ